MVPFTGVGCQGHTNPLPTAPVMLAWDTYIALTLSHSLGLKNKAIFLVYFSFCLSVAPKASNVPVQMPFYSPY